MNLRTKLAGLVALAAVTPAFAQIKLNDNVSVTGWAVGSYQYADARTTNGSGSTDSANVDAALLGATITPTKDVTAVFSTYYRPNTGNGLSGDTGATATGQELTLLDAYVSYAPNGSTTITAGKFLSYLGFESFYLADDNQITLANQQFLAPVPGYHDGVKIDYTIDKANTIGAAFVDSLYSPNVTVNGSPAGSTEGTGNLRSTAGAEAYYQYTGIDGLTVWFGYGYDKKAANADLVSSNVGSLTLTNGGETTTYTVVGSPVYPEVHSVSVYDLWATYTLGKNDSVSAEEIYKDGGSKFGASSGEGSDWLVEESHSFTPKFATLLRLSGEDVTGGYYATNANHSGLDPRLVKYTLSPSYAVTANLTVRAEYSYIHYSNYLIATNDLATDANFFGVQAVLKF